MTRYAIYAAPGTGTGTGTGTAGAGAAGAGAAGAAALALRERAERWLGRSAGGDPGQNPADASPVTPGTADGWTRADIDAITGDARRYGFHATLKAPFRLAESRTAGELDDAVARFAASRAAVTVPSLSLACVGAGFYALVPGEDAPELNALAADAVTSFDGFRAPPTEAETARRRPERLSPRQRELLAAWGYPYVLEEFRFHLTLTDPVPPERRPGTERVLSGWFAGSLGAGIRLDALAVFTEAEPGAPFTVRSVHPLRPAPAPVPATPYSEGTR